MRHPDWQARLLATIRAATVRPFVWGMNDCCTFGADCCVAVCGTDPAAAHRGHYQTEQGAARAQVRFGTMEQALDAVFARVPPAMAQRGDAVLFDGPAGTTAGILWAGQIWAMTPDGARAIPGVLPTIAWRVE